MNKLQKFMMGRYGVDQLYYLLLTLSIVLTLISMFSGWQFLDIIAMFLLFFAIFRIFSKNTSKRYEENTRFLNKINPIRSKIKKFVNKTKSRKNYRYFNCPECREEMKVPKGKGKIMITCPNCHTKFQSKT